MAEIYTRKLTTILRHFLNQMGAQMGLQQGGGGAVKSALGSFGDRQERLREFWGTVKSALGSFDGPSRAP